MQSTSRTDEEQHVERVIVSVRLRPFTEDEYLRDRETCIETFDPNNKVVVVKKEFEKKIFNYDYLLDPQIQQNNVYSLVAQDVVEGVLRGYNGTIFAYGQTGTGKTHTMLGVPNDVNKQGIIPRALEHIFETAANDNKYNYEIRIAYLQIYMEILQDLIQPSNTDIKIRESPESGVFITGNTWVSVKSVEGCLDVLTNAEKNRTFAFTTLNATSSRSHAVFIVKLEKRLKLTIDQVETLEKQNSLTNTSIITSILYLVDLAGSERVKKSKISGERLEEAISINSSLTALGKCIHALTDPKTNYVPFRESKLTRILQDSLGGNAKTALIVNIGPSLKNLEETLSTLYFGSRAMKVKNRPFINKQKDYYALSMQLQGELDAKDDEINRMQIKLSDLLNEVNVMKSEYEKYKLISESSDKLMKSLTKTYNTSNLKGIIDKIESSRQEELEHLELRYKQILIEKDKQHKEFLEEIDQLMLEQENEINDLKQRNDHFQTHLENMDNEKEYLKEVLESERNQFKGRNSVLEVEKNQLNLLVEQMRNQINQDLDKERDLLARILELEEKLQDKNQQYNSKEKEKSLQNAAALYNHEKEKENFSNREEELKKVIETLRAVISQKDTMLENEEKFKNLEIQNLKEKIQTLNNNLETLKKEKNDYVNKDRQNALKIQDLEATIIKFGDEKNKAWDNLRDNEDFYKKEIADLKEKLAHKDQNLSNNDKLKQTEDYYLQKLKNMQAQNDEKEHELQAKIGELQVILDEKENQLQRMISDFKLKEEMLSKQENQASHDVKDLENQLHYKNQEFLNFEKRFTELNSLLKEKDAQINQLREFIGSQEGTNIEKGAKNSKRINELEEKLQQKNNEFYKLQDELIRQEQMFKLEIQKLQDENMLHLNESMEVKNREASSKNMTDALKTEIEKIQKSNVELVQMLSKHQEESSTAKKQLSNSLLDKDREIDSLRALLSTHEIKSIQTTSQVTEAQGLRELERARLTNRINDCEEQISLKDREISNLRKTIQQVEEDIRNLRLEIQRKDQEYTNIIDNNQETLRNLQIEAQKKDDQYSDLLYQLQNIQNENNQLKSEIEEQKLIHQDAVRNKEEDSEFLVKKLNSVQKEKEDSIKKYEELLKTKDQEILKLRNQTESFGGLTPITPVINNNQDEEINLMDVPDEAPIRSASFRELEMQLELQMMEHETLKMVSEELKEENVKLKIMLRKQRPGELNEGDSFSLDDSRMRSSYFHNQSDLQDITEEQELENSPAKKEDIIKNKANQILKLQQSLENEIFQKEILLSEKDTLITKIKELEAQIAANPSSGQQPQKSATEGERMMNNFKRAERDREEYEQKIKELKKIIEMNQTQFSNQLKNINSKHDKAIQELNEQITELKEMNDGLELQAADSAHAVELIAQKDQEIEHLNEEIKKLTQKGKENSQKLKDLENDLKNFNDDYEKLETENRNLMSTIEKSKYNVLEYSSQMQERDLQEQKLYQDLEEYKHSVELLEEKVMRLETELRRVSTKKMHLEFELKNQSEQYTQEVCQVVLENCLMAVQMQELSQDMKEVTGIQKMKSMFSNQVSLAPSRKWLQTVGQAYMKKNPIFSIGNFNTFLDNFSYFQGNLNDAYIQYEEVFSALGAPTQSPEKRSPIKKRIEPTRKVDMSEVQSVLDNMLVVLEVQDEIENQIQLDLKWFGLDMYIEREIDRNLIRGDAAKTQLLLKPKYMTLTQTTKAVSDINTSSIFTSKYVKNLQAMIQSSQPTQDTAINFIACDAKLLQKIMAINEGSINSSRSNNDLIVDLTTLFLNTYNYCSYIKQKNDFQEKLIKDLQGVVQTCIRYLTFKEVELKVSEKTRKVLLKRYLSLVKAFKADKKTFKEYSTQVQKKEKFASAALIIQRFYRRWKQRQMERYAFRTDFQLQRERKNSKNLSKNADDFNAKTGKLLIQQSMNHMNIVFNDMREIFLQKTSLKYTKFKQHYNAIPKKNETQ